MIKLAIFVCFAIIFGVTAQNGIPTSEESIDELVAAGLTENAASGIVKFDGKFEEPFELEKTDPEAAKKIIDQLHIDFNEYIDSLSESDQNAYQRYIKNKHSQI